MNNLSINSGIFFGIRGNEFKEFIKGLLSLGKIKKSYIDILTEDESIKEYEKAFTSEQVDEKNNYQFYEQIGDVAANKFMVYYMYRRFPQLKCPEGVKVAARVKINYCSKESFSRIAEEYDFWKYITAPCLLRENNRKDLLEDVFEAFIGVTEYLIDEKVKYKENDIYGVGYASVYRILKVIFDKIEINIKHEELYDAKTRLKEVFDLYRERLGEIKYESMHRDINNRDINNRETNNRDINNRDINNRDNLETICTISRLDGIKYETLPDGKINFKKYSGTPTKVILATATAKYKDQAEQLASSIAIKNLENQGFVKYPPSIYAILAGEKKITRENLSTIMKCKNTEEVKNKVNTPIIQKGNTKYTAPPIFLYCKRRDNIGIKECIDNGADISILDCYGLSVLDRILIGDIDVEKVQKCIKHFRKKDKIKVSKNIYEIYNNVYNLDKSLLEFIN
jgi:dsRNA-specific ribonuclease